MLDVISLLGTLPGSGPCPKSGCPQPTPAPPWLLPLAIIGLIVGLTAIWYVFERPRGTPPPQKPPAVWRPDDGAEPRDSES